MLPSIDTYVHDKLETSIKKILDVPEVVETILGNLDEQTRKSFINYFCKSKAELDVTYSFPQTQDNALARIVIQLGEEKKVAESMGNIEGSYTYREGGTRIESSKIQYNSETNKLEIPLEYNIGEIYSFSNISFSRSDEVSIKDNKIIFNYEGNESLENEEIKVSYEELKEGNIVGVKEGFTTSVDVLITPMSTNIDIARGLDLLIKTILIMMMENPEEHTIYLLQGYKAEAMTELAYAGETYVPDNTLYGRPIVLNYTISNNIDYDYNNKIKNILVTTKEGVENDSK